MGTLVSNLQFLANHDQEDKEWRGLSVQLLGCYDSVHRNFMFSKAKKVIEKLNLLFKNNNLEQIDTEDMDREFRNFIKHTLEKKA